MNLRLRSLQIRLVLWFTVGTLLTVSVFSVATFFHLREELRDKQVEAYYPDHPEWALHGSIQDTGEIADIMTELVETGALFAVPLLILTILLGMRLARLSLEPIADINRQLQALGSANLSSRVDTRSTDQELGSLVRHLNDLLGRLDKSFVELRDYVAHVTHEIRTPLAVMRLKLERAEGRVDEEMSEEIQSELHRLSVITDQALLIARAEHGRIDWNPETFALRPLIEDCVEDFEILAENEGRHVLARRIDDARVTTDRFFVKQILYLLLANTMKHGEGDIHLRAKRRNHSIAILVVNRVKPAASAKPPLTLGLGLRLAHALLRLQSVVTLQRRPGPRRYCVLLRIATS